MTDTKSMLGRILDEYKDFPDADLSSQLAYAKHMKANYQSMVDAIYIIQQRRREAGVSVPVTH